MCCHSNLCNNIPRKYKKKNKKLNLFLLIHLVSWSIWRKWYQKTTTRRPEPPAATTTAQVTTRRTTIKRTTEAPPQFYFVNEIVNGEREPS